MTMSATRLRTTVLINLASILEKCDEQILPALFSRVGATFQATPAQLGNVALVRAFMQALSSPLAGVASHVMPRGRVIGTGCLLWATFTALFGCTSSLLWAMPLVAVNGIGLALVIPSVQSLTADLNASESRGRAFGALWLTISFGGMLGALFATNMGSLQIFGMEGWRFAFFTVAILSAVTGVLNALYVHDPTYTAHQQSSSSSSASTSQLQRRAPGGARSSSPSAFSNTENPPLKNKVDAAFIKSMVADISGVLKIPTFALIICQGIVGSVPFASLVFLTLYLQLMGMSDAAASGLVATYLVGGGLGGLLGGWIGDMAAKSWPNHGRVAATQVSVASGIPFAFLIFKGLPMNGELGTVALYAAVIFTFAVCTAWPAPCANNPIFSEIVPVRQRNLVYAFDRCFEGAIAAFATPLVGRLAERIYGFSGASTVTGDTPKDLLNAQALGSALLAFLVVPWTLCLITYTGLHWTYPIDKRRAVVLNRKASSDRMIFIGGGEEGTSNGLIAGEGGGGGVGGGSGSTSTRLGSSSLLQRQGSYHSDEKVPLTGSGGGSNV